MLTLALALSGALLVQSQPDVSNLPPEQAAQVSQVFGGMTRLAVRDGKEIKKRTKELMTSLINGALQRKQLIFPSDDLEVEDQFTTHTYTLRDGKIIYSKGNDHIIDAVRCAMLIREEGNLDPVGEEVVSLKPILTNPVFI